jgi:hypothetical protein
MRSKSLAALLVWVIAFTPAPALLIAATTLITKYRDYSATPYADTLCVADLLAPDGDQKTGAADSALLAVSATRVTPSDTASDCAVFPHRKVLSIEPIA